MTVWEEILTLLCAGVLGGVVFGLRVCPEHKLRLPRTGRRIELGIVGDAIVGAATSLAASGVASSTNLISLTGDPSNPALLKLVSFGIISGYAGIQLLSGISSRLVQDLQGVKERVESVERREESLWKCSRADSLREHGRYDEAEREFNEALRLDPDNDLAVIGLAKVFRWKGQRERAIQLLTELIDKNPNASRAIYNRACYKALLNQSSEAIADLKRAIQIDPFYAPYAQKDPDFDSLRSDPEFLALVVAAAPLPGQQERPEQQQKSPGGNA